MKPVRVASVDALTEALGRALSPHAATDDGWTDLHYAATLDLADEAVRLLAQGVPPSSPLKDDLQDLDEHLMAHLRAFGCEFSTWAREGDTPLHLAAWSNAVHAARVLLDHGANVHAKLVMGGTALNVAARFNAAETAALLLEHGADWQSTDQRGWMPLHAAVSSGAVETATLLLEHGADVTLPVEDEQFTPLHLAIMPFTRTPSEEMESLAVVRLLLDWGAPVNAVTKNFGATPLDIAEAVERPNVARALRAHGGDITLDEPRVLALLKARLGPNWGVMVRVTERRRRPPRNRR